MRHTFHVLTASIVIALTAPMVHAGDTHSVGSGNEVAQIRGILDNLTQDNAVYVKSHKPAYFQDMIAGQHPRATIITCSDSRVHTHALDKTPDGDLFMIRNIGNQLVTAEGSVEYGVRHLHTPVLMIIGHASCGAVKAAMGGYEDIEPAIKKELYSLHVLGKNAKDNMEVMNSVESNVHDQVKAATQKFEPEIKSGKLMVLGAVYDFRNDYKQGNGRLVLVDVNGEKDPAKIKAATQFKD